MTLMTHFCAGEDSWLARSKNNASDAGTPEVKITKTSLNATDTSVETTVTTPRIRWLMPDSVALCPVSGRSRSKRTIQAHPVWTSYSIVHMPKP